MKAAHASDPGDDADGEPLASGGLVSRSDDCSYLRLVFVSPCRRPLALGVMPAAGANPVTWPNTGGAVPTTGVMSEAGANPVTWRYAGGAVPTTGASDLRLLGAHFQQLMRGDRYRAAFRSIELARQLPPDPGVDFVTDVAGVGGRTLIGFAIRRQKPRLADRSLAWFSTFSARGLTALAAQLAGRKRPGLRDEWRAHLAGKSGHDPVTWPKVKEALGFVASALQCRCTDAADAAWTPVDAILKSRKLSNLLVFGPTATAAMCILRHLGTLGLLTSAESISAIGGGLYGLVRVGRWWRDVKPPEPKARRAKEK